MNSKAWRAKGYRTIHRAGLIYLVELPKRSPHAPPETPMFMAEIHGGKWMECDDLGNPDVWTQRTLAQFDYADGDNFARTVRACYCDEGVQGCDFCMGHRSPPSHAELDSFAARHACEAAPQKKTEKMEKPRRHAWRLDPIPGAEDPEATKNVVCARALCHQEAVRSGKTFRGRKTGRNLTTELCKGVD
jgi:hypothetical protein